MRPAGCKADEGDLRPLSDWALHEDAEVAALALGFVQGFVGSAYELGDRFFPVPAGDSDRTGLVLGRGCAQSLGDLDGRLRRAVGERKRELLAPVAGQEVGRAQLVAPRGCRLLEEAVAGLVAALVVERLEMVEVEHRDAEGTPLALGSRELARNLLLP